MAIRNVPKSHTFEQQRQVINLLAQDIGDVSLLEGGATNLVQAVNAASNSGPSTGLLINGDTDPTNEIGTEDDFYFKTTTKELFGPKTNGTWPTESISFGGGLLYGTTDPEPSVGVEGNYYINTVTKDLFGPKTLTSWPVAAISLSEQLLSGTSDPDSNTGKVGDYYLNLQTRDLFGPKTEIGWENVISLSEQVLSGTLPPLSATGKIGDFYLDLQNRNLYGPKTVSGWGTPIPLSEEEVGTVIFVRPNGSDLNSGLSIRNSVKSLKQACKIAQSLSGNITIRMFSGEYYEDNPIYVPKGTSIVGDNLRETILRPLNDGEDFLWVTSGSYINYLVFRDNYGDVNNPEDSSRGVGYLNTGSSREISESETTINLFPGHTLKRVDGIYKDGSNIIEYKKLDIVDYAFNEMIIEYPGLVIPGADPNNVCKRDIGYYVDAIIHDLRHGGNLKVVQFGKSYFNFNNELDFIENELNETISALNYAKTIIISYIQNISITQEQDYLNQYDPVTQGSCVNVVSAVETLTSIAIDILQGGDGPRINPGPGYVLIDQEWMEVDDLSGNVLTISSRGINNPITNEPSLADRHISGAVITQGSRVWKYAVCYPSQAGLSCRGRITISSNSSSVVGLGTNFTSQCFAGGSIKVAGISYVIQSITDDTNLTLSSTPLVDINGSKFLFTPPKERIFLSPYTQNCSAISVLGNAYYDSNINQYDASKTRGGGLLVDGSELESNTPIKSMVVDAFTQVVSGGIGFHIKEDGYAQLVSVFQVFESVGVLAESGGYASITNSATNFGEEGLKAVGFSENPYPFFTGNVSSISNVTKTSFNSSPSDIVQTTYQSFDDDNKVRAFITVPTADISKFEIGQIITLENHTIPNPSNYQVITDLQTAVNDTFEIEQIDASNNKLTITIDIPWSSFYNIAGFGGGQSGTLSITQGSTYTSITAIGFDTIPLVNYIIKIDGLPPNPNGEEYVISEILEYEENNYARFSTQVKVPNSDINSVANNAPINLRAPSTVNSSGHTFEYVGSGINYTALPQNGGKANSTTQVVEVNSGKGYVSGTDQDGNFLVGPYFKVDLRTGKASFTGSVALGVLDEIQLKQSPGVPIYEFSTDINLGGGTGAKHTALPTQKAVRDYITSSTVLGNLIGLNKGTSSQAGLLVQLDSNGKINPNQLPPAPVVAVFNVPNETDRLNLGITNPEINQGDLAYQEDTEITYILTSLPTNVPTNWQVFSGTNINASNIVSGVIGPERLGTGIANDSTFLNGISKYTPVVQGVTPASNSPVLVSGNTLNVKKTGITIPVSSALYDSQVDRVFLNTSSPHNITNNSWVEIEGIYPTGYNGLYQVSVVDIDTISYASSSDPGLYISGGYITSGVRFDSGFAELDVRKASFFAGQSSGSSDLGVVKYEYNTFNINESNVLSLREKGVQLGKIENIRIRSLIGNNEFTGDANGEGNVIELPLGEDVEQVPVFGVNIDSNTQKYFFRDTVINVDIGVSPTLSVTRGKSYKFTMNVAGQPFYITTKPKINPLTDTSFVYTKGLKVINRETGSIFFTVPQDAPKILYYQSSTDLNNYGILSVITNDSPNIKYTTSTNTLVVDSFNKLSFATCKYLIQINNLDGSNIHSTELLLMHDGTTVFLTEYATLFSTVSLGTFTAAINNNDVELAFTPTGPGPVNLSIKLVKTTMF